MKILELSLHRLALPLNRPFRTAFGTISEREILLIRVLTDTGIEGWGECAALSEPLYSAEYLDGCTEIICRFFGPAILRAGEVRAGTVAELLKHFAGNPMAKAAIEGALLDAQLKMEGRSLASYLGAEREFVDAGVAVGMFPSIEELLSEVDGYVREGYRRVKLKIAPGWDVIPVGAVRDCWSDLPLQVDANQSYNPGDISHLGKLDRFDLVLIEQPFDEFDLQGHAELAKRIGTRVCLDESIISLGSCRTAVTMGAASVINIKPSRVGGILEAVRIHDFCLEEAVPVWCGGMLESGVGRSANLALAALPGFTCTGDLSASSRYFVRDLAGPFVLEDGRIAVPRGIGMVPDLDREFVDSLTTRKLVVDI